MTEFLLPNRAVVFGPAKEAALYFDEILPLTPVKQTQAVNLDQDRHSDFLPGEGVNIDENILTSLLGEKAKSSDFRDILMSSVVGVYLAEAHNGDQNLSELLEGHDRTKNIFKQLGIDYAKIDLQSGSNPDVYAGAMSVLFDNTVLPAYRRLGFSGAAIWGGERDDATLTSPASIFVSLRDHKIIDISSIDWPTVVEFRKDKSSRAALRDFRLFFTDNFSGRDPAFVVDKLGYLMDQYDQTAKRWGLTTTHRAFSAVTTKENGILAGGSILSIAAGGPAAFVGAAGIMFELVKAGLEIGKTVLEARDDLSANPIRYLTNVRSLASDGR